MTSQEKSKALADAEKAGIDLSLIDVNLSLSVRERWQQHDDALSLALKLAAAGKARDAKLQSTAATAH